MELAFLNTIIIKYKCFVHLNTYKDIKLQIFDYSGFLSRVMTKSSFNKPLIILQYLVTDTENYQLLLL